MLTAIVVVAALLGLTLLILGVGTQAVQAEAAEAAEAERIRRVFR